MPTDSSTVYVGIDVCAVRLDLARHDSDKAWAFDNDPAGREQLVALLRSWSPERIAVESTGKIERLLLAALIDAGLPVCHVNPQRVRQFASGMGRVVKTDRIDAKVLAQYADKAEPRVMTKTPEKQAELAELLACRKQLLDARTAHNNQVKRCGSDFSLKRLQSVLKTLDAEIDLLDERIAKTIDDDPDMSRTQKILRSVTGVGPVLAATLIACLRELGSLDHKPLTALVGVVPYNRDSGKFAGKRSISGGRANVRSVLYMCTIAAVRHNPVFKEKYKQLKAAGKPTKVAIIACVRKLLRILNALVRDGVEWVPPKLKTA